MDRRRSFALAAVDFGSAAIVGSGRSCRLLATILFLASASLPGFAQTVSGSTAAPVPEKAAPAVATTPTANPKFNGGSLPEEIIPARPLGGGPSGPREPLLPGNPAGRPPNATPGKQAPSQPGAPQATGTTSGGSVVTGSNAGTATTTPSPAYPGPEIPEAAKIARWMRGMSPEERQKFQDNLNRWSQMRPEQREALRVEMEKRQAQVKQAVDKALKESGLVLTPDQEELYTARYTQERRRIEQQVRKEMDERRNLLLKDSLDKLKEEFATQSKAGTDSTPGDASPSPSPSSAPSVASTPQAK